jgi:simple sugar transport system permease protein
MIPVLFAATGGLFPALAGTLNIALEGMLLMGAFSSLTVFYFTGSYFAAISAAVACAMALCALQTFSVFKLRANIFICGLAINLLSSGLCIVLSDKIFDTRGVIALQNYRTPIGFVNWYFFLIIFLLVISHLVIFNTPFGYRLRACEKSGDSLISLGIVPQFYQINALLISAVFCGIGGSFLSLNLGAFVPEMSAGKGWIALVVIFLGAHKPAGLIAAALVFSFAESFSNHAQGFWSFPSDFMLALPYIITLLAMMFSGKRQ